MNPKKAYLYIVFILVSCHLFSQNKLEINGFFEYDHISYFKTKPNTLISQRNQGIFQLDLKKKINEKTMVFSSLDFRQDLSDKTRNRVFPIEYYVDFSLKNIDLRIGKQIYSWGRANTINITDNINHLNYFDFLDIQDEKIGVISANAKFYYKKWTFQGIVTPVFSTSTLPKNNSAWSRPQPNTINNPTNPEDLINVDYTFMPNIEPRKNTTSAQFAGKIDGKVKGIDFSVSYYSGYSNLPEFITTENIKTSDSITIASQEIYIPWDIIGFDFAMSIGSIGLRGEAGYFHPKGKEAKIANSDEDFFQYSLGLDYMSFIGQGNSSISIIAEWANEIVPSGFEYSSTSLNHLYQQAFIGKLEYNYMNIFKISTQSLYDIKNNGYYLQPKISYTPIDNLNITLLTDILDGDDTGFFGIYSDNDRFQCKIKYSF